MNKIAFFLRIILSASMILAGGTKIINPTDFSSVLVYSIHFSETAGALIATILPVLELLSGLLVLFPGISGRVGIIIIRCLLFIFLVFHILNLLLNFSTNNCFCYGLLFDFSNTQMLVIVLILFGISCLHIQRFYRIETAKISSDLKIFTKSDFLFAIIVFVFFVFSLSIRYQHIRKDSDSGIISKSENIFFQERIKNILESLSSPDSKSVSHLFVFAKSSGCSPCISEFLFWNNAEIPPNVRIVGVYPYSESEQNDWEAFKRLYRIKFKILSINEQDYFELFGKKNIPITRIAFSSRGEILLIDSKSETDSQKKLLLANLHKLFNTR